MEKFKLLNGHAAHAVHATYVYEPPMDTLNMVEMRFNVKHDRCSNAARNHGEISSSHVLSYVTTHARRFRVKQ